MLTSPPALWVLSPFFLSCSQSQAGKIELDCSSFSVRDCVESTIDVLAQKASAKGVCLLSYVDPSVPAIVWSDPVRVKQILL